MDNKFERMERIFFRMFIAAMCVIGLMIIFLTVVTVKQRKDTTKFEVTYYNGDKEIVYERGHYYDHDIYLNDGCFKDIDRCGIRSVRILEVIEK